MRGWHGLAALLLSSSFAAAAEVQVRDAWVRATVPAQKVTGAFMTLWSAEAARVVSISSPMARRTEMHMTHHKDGVAHMHAMPAIDLEAGVGYPLQPGGAHVMLIGLTAQLKEGDKVPLTLIVEGRDGTRRKVEAQAAVRPLTAR